MKNHIKTIFKNNNLFNNLLDVILCYVIQMLRHIDFKVFLFHILILREEEIDGLRIRVNYIDIYYFSFSASSILCKYLK